VDKKRSKKSNTASINSLITSAIVNAPPPGAAIDLLEINAGVVEKVDTHIKAGLCRFPPDRETMYIRGRNFLELHSTETRGIICKWKAEGELHKVYSFYIRPPTAGAKPDLKLVNEDPVYVSLKVTGEKIKGWFH